MTSAMTQALPTSNAVKKGWSAAARLKSALVRKAKKKPTPLKKVSPNSPEYKKLKAGDKEKVLNNALKQFDKQGSAYRSVKTKGYKNLLDVRVEANKSIGRFEGMARAYRKRAKGLKGKKRRIYLHMALNCLQQASQLSSDVMKRKRPVTTNMIKTLLIINAFQESTNNAKKGSKGVGWSAKARIAAALARKKKVGGSVHKKRVAAFQNAQNDRRKLASQSVKSMTEARKILGLPDYLHKGGSSKAHQEVVKKALSTASSLTDPTAVRKYKDLAKVHKDLAKQFKSQDKPRVVKTGTKSGESKAVKKTASKSDPYAGGPTWKNGKPTYGKADESKAQKRGEYLRAQAKKRAEDKERQRNPPPPISREEALKKRSDTWAKSHQAWLNKGAVYKPRKKKSE